MIQIPYKKMSLDIIAVPPKHANVYYSVFFGGGGVFIMERSTSPPTKYNEDLGEFYPIFST